MMTGRKFIAWFAEIGKDDVNVAGGKGANLGEMTQIGIPVPPGFIITAPGYFYFLEKNNLRKEISDKLKNLDVDDTKNLQRVALEIKEKITSAQMPPELSKIIREEYHHVVSQDKNPLVAVRSSATAEDLPDASFAGQQRTYLNVKGEKGLLVAVLGCYASLFESRAIFYRQSKGFDHFKVGIAVPIQKMVQSEASGIIFTVDPISSDPSKIIIEAVYGLGETVVSGAVTPDQYVVDKKTFTILEKHIVKQTWQLMRKTKYREGEDPNLKVKISPAYQEKQKIADEHIIELARIAFRLENHYRHPQDIEWALENDHIFLVQTRPVTTLNIVTAEGKLEFATSTEGKEAEIPLLVGLGASPGIGIGKVKIIKSPSEINKILKGDILVTEMTTPDFVPAMKRAVAIVTDKGGRTCHAAIVSRELGIPCVVGTEKATQILKNGETLTVDGTQGKVFQGEIKIEKTSPQVQVVPKSTDRQNSSKIHTATKVYVNLAEPELAQQIAQRDVDGVGLLRAEFMIAEIGEHPKALIKKHKEELFIEKLSEGILTIAKAFNPRPVIYRATDFKTNEYKNLKGGAEFEPEEPNPMLGYRGCLRYITDSDVFRLELSAIKKVRHYHKNLWLMIPFVRTPQELSEAKKIMASEGLNRSSTFKLFMMVEIPSNIILLDKFIGVGIDGISIGSNDLTQLILGVDRDNPQIAAAFDERNEAVLWAMEKAITTSTQHGIAASICGQAPSDYPEITSKLIEWGITSVSVNPDMIEKTREIVSEAEMRLVRMREI
ncbi:phosphoenolpyruvate synthase [candidate division WWE3 bacterium CG_4_8_14_3_um_filter_42_11]|uniref:Phosphoenolpyruvate synthase n=2 Tax=Katanobacteria TaxID=422282 RepID=A0A2M7TDI5_UNCKA|nr:MAG: phosphoenolpyruvate synthase [candidate division WWE3 bacterium CG_4_10_14_0_2_um_filter_42_8]PJC69325.1 MAG: phosphoenolpyruvate synthase [candidate division WWE3 bacterium CG_4_8_14_3_um_filter_42_11]